MTAVVFWDFDGTLASREGRWSGALVDALRQVDPHSVVAREALRPHLRTGFPWHQPEVVTEALSPSQWWARLLPTILAACEAVAVPRAVAEAAADLLPEVYYRVDAWTIAPDATSALATALAAGYRNVIVSNHGPELPDLVRNLELDKLIDATITSAAVGAEKPNPAFFRHALDATGADLATSWMVGDNPAADIAGAEAVGLRAILIATSVLPDHEGVDLRAAIERMTNIPQTLSTRPLGTHRRAEHAE